VSFEEQIMSKDIDPRPLRAKGLIVLVTSRTECKLRNKTNVVGIKTNERVSRSIVPISLLDDYC